MDDTILGGGDWLGGEADTAALHRMPFRDDGRTPQDVALRGKAGRKTQPGELVEGCRNHTGGLQGRKTCGTMRLADNGDGFQGGRHQLLGDCPVGGSVEINIQHHQLPAIVFHPVPWRSTQISCRERNGDRHPWGKVASAAHHHEGYVCWCHIPWLAQVIWCPGQGTMSWYLDGIWSGSQDTPHSADILIPAPDGGKGGGVLRACLTDPRWGNSGGPPITHNI